MKRLLVAALLALVPVATATARPLRGVRVADATVACVFEPGCVITGIEDTSSPFVLPGALGEGRLFTRTFDGKTGAPAAGLHAYLYRIDLTQTRGTVPIPSVQTFSLGFGEVEPLDYDGDGTSEDYFVVEPPPGTAGIAPDFVDLNGTQIALHYYDGVPAGQTSLLIGFASRATSQSLTARATEGLSASIVDAVIRAPFYNPCNLRPDLNAMGAAQRDVLDDLTLDYIDSCIIGQHYTPDIHSIANLLPWHRTYIAGLENYLSMQGHPEFVPFPKWEAANPIPAEFQDVDPGCTTADTDACLVNAPADGPFTCAPLADTTPNVAKPASLVYPALCDYEDRDALTSGLNGYHGSGHIFTGGVMGNFHSPSANIFWAHHGNIDNIWKEWECRCNSIIAIPVDFYPLDILTPCRFLPCWVAWFQFEDPRIYDTRDTLPDTYGDLRGTPNVGVPYGGPKIIGGKVGTALSFDGVDDFVQVDDHEELRVGAEDLAIDLWMMTRSPGMQPLVEKRDDAGTGFSFFLMDGMPGFELRAGAAGPAVGGMAPLRVDDGLWHHLAVSVDRDSPIGGRLFVDGKVVATFDPTPGQGDLGGAGPLMIGRGGPSARDQKAFFMGALDEVDLFRRALKPVEVLGIAEAGSAGKTGALSGQQPVTFREICNGRAAGEPGTRVTVPITLNEGGGVAGFQVDLNFDPTVLTPVSVMPGTDTAAGGWTVVMAPVGPGVLRLLGESNPPAGLGPGPREVARVEFDIAAAAPVGPSSLTETGCVLGDEHGATLLCRPCDTPGAVIVRTASAFRFRPLPSIVGVDLFDPLPFTAAVEAVDSMGNLATGYGRTAMMSVTPGVCPANSLSPALLPFTAGLGGPDTFRVFCCPDVLSGFPLTLEASDAPLEISGTGGPVSGIAKGDLDASGMTDVLDVQRDVRLSLALSVAQPPATSFQVWAGDMPDEHCQVDRVNNVLDVLRVRNRSLGRMPLCPCEGPFAHESATTLQGPAAPLGVRLEKGGPRTWLVVVSGAANLGGLQFEIKGASPDTVVTADGLAGGRGWQVFTDAGQANRMGVLAYAGAQGGISGDGVVLRITGAGSPKIRSVIASDQDGRALPVQ